MVLYHAVSTYQLLEFMIHANTVSKNVEADIVISKDIIDRFEDCQNKLKQFFNNVMIYDNREANNLLIDEKSFFNYFERIFQEKKININKYDKFYISCTHAAFPLYLAMRDIKMVFFEDAAGALSNIQGIIDHVKKISNERHKKLSFYGLYNGIGKAFEYRIYNKESQKDNFQIESSDKFFNVAYELNVMDSDLRLQIVEFFYHDKKILDESHNSVLILTEHFANLGVMSWEEQILIYQLSIDYLFSEKNLIFKIHPDDLMYYSYLFPKSKVIRNKFPAEILPYIFEHLPEDLFTVSSSAIHGLRKYFKNSIIFNQEFSYYKKQYYDLHKYFAVTRIFLQKKYDGRKVFCSGINETVLQCFFNKYEINNTIENIETFNLEEKSILIVDKFIEHEDVIYQIISNKKDVIVIFFEFKNNIGKEIPYDLYFDNLNIIKIKKEPFKKNEIEINLDDEYVYYYSKERGDYMKNNDIEKVKLNHTGIDVKISELDEKDVKIKVLEGILESMEDRLLNIVKGKK